MMPSEGWWFRCPIRDRSSEQDSRSSFQRSVATAEVVHIEETGAPMTVAICIECGSKKFGAFNSCAACKYRPTDPDDLAKSMVFTDHYFGQDQLGEIGTKIASGENIELDDQTLSDAMKAVESTSAMRMMGLTDPATVKPISGSNSQIENFQANRRIGGVWSASSRLAFEMGKHIVRFIKHHSG